jgi:hypothetical protein
MFVRPWVEVFSRRSAVFAVLNAAFFGSIFVSALVVQLLVPPSPYEGESDWIHVFLLGLEWPLMMLVVFLFNLVFSGFALLTLSGFVFFPLPAVVLVMRGALWGFMLTGMPTWLFLLALPTMVLEGEGYVAASVAGTVLGLSWVKPGWVYEEGSPRGVALRKAFNEAVRLYLLVATLFLVAAIIEVVTIHYVA